MYGIKVSKPGKDVLTAANKDLVFTSESESAMKISGLYSLSTTISSAPGSATLSTAHGLGFVPAFFGSVQLPSGDHFLCPVLASGAIMAKVYADNTNIYARIVTLLTGSYTFKIVVFNEQIAS